MVTKTSWGTEHGGRQRRGIWKGAWSAQPPRRSAHNMGPVSGDHASRSLVSKIVWGKHFDLFFMNLRLLL